MEGERNGSCHVDVIASNGQGFRITSSTSGYCFPSIILSLATHHPDMPLDVLEPILHQKKEDGGLLSSDFKGGVSHDRCCRMANELGLTFMSAEDFYE